MTPDIRSKLDKRLARIEGQVGGLRRMVSQERYCVDILSQIAAVQESLRGAAQELMKSHLHHCVSSGATDPERREKLHEEIADLFRRFTR